MAPSGFVSTVSLSRINVDLYFATHVMCRLLMLCLSWNSCHGHSRSLCVRKDGHGSDFSFSS